LFQDQSRFAEVQINLGASHSAIRSLAPPGITVTAYAITVTGPGMDPIHETIPANIPFISLIVPAGDDRRFTIEADLTPAPALSHLLSFIGRNEADLEAGSVTFLTFKMVAGRTELIVPDYLNNQLFRASDMSFSDSQTGTFGLGGAFAPIDIDISADGKIFIARRSASNGIVFGDDINGANAVTINASNVTAIAIDKVNNILYYSTYDDITHAFSLNRRSLPYNPLASPAPLNDSVMVVTATGPEEHNFSVVGMDVDPWSSSLYLAAYTLDAGGVPLAPIIIRYDPNGQVSGKANPGRVLRSTIHPDFRIIGDIVAKDDAVFVANSVPAGADELAPILQFGKNLTFTGSYGRISDEPVAASWQIKASVAAGDFYGPKRFLAKGNTALTIIDDSVDYDKLVSLSQGLDDTSWETYPAVETATPPFRFFE
jgi:hypothetical protein